MIFNHDYAFFFFGNIAILLEMFIALSQCNEGKIGLATKRVKNTFHLSLSAYYRAFFTTLQLSLWGWVSPISKRKLYTVTEPPFPVWLSSHQFILTWLNLCYLQTNKFLKAEDLAVGRIFYDEAIRYTLWMLNVCFAQGI